MFLTFGISGCAEYLVAEAVLATVSAIEDNTKQSRTNNYSKPYNPSSEKTCYNTPSMCSDFSLCLHAAAGNKWEKVSKWALHVNEAKSRGLDCGVNNKYKLFREDIAKYRNKEIKPLNKEEEILNQSDEVLLATACKNGEWDTSNNLYVIEAKNRTLDCVVEGIAATFNVSDKIFNNNKNFSVNTDKAVSNYSDYVICLRSSWKEDYKKYQLEAKRRDLDCGVIDNNTTIASNKNKNPTNRPLATVSVSTVCYNATVKTGKTKIWNTKNYKFVEEARKRNLTCGVSDSGQFAKLMKMDNESICSFAITNNGSYEKRLSYLPFVEESKRRGLDCGVKDSKKVIVASKPKTVKPIISSAELDAERQKRLQLERELAEIKNKQKQEQKTINSDNQEPTINVFAKQDGSNAIISGHVTDNTKVAEVLVDGQVQQIKSNGTFETPFYIPRTGKTIEIVAFDVKGNKASKFIKLERDNIQQANVQKFKSLNPSLKRVKANPNALALIIGISDYENTKASALYADSDAKMFYDYANLKLGIPSSNIKELVGNNAKRLDIFKSVRSFLLKRTVTDKTDIYVFFAGHGLATDDGKGMYLLPYDGDPEYLEDSAIKRKKLFADIQATKPRSVTVFLDTCYSGGTRNEETLVAILRPIIITAKEQSVPDNFTVLSAAKGNQTSQSLEEVKHGLFSYYTMLGMEGGADGNNDNKITARELHAFIKDKVERQSQFRQTPELQGDKDRVLVQFN